MIRYRCKSCHALLESEDALGGLADTCPICNKTVSVPFTKAQLRAARDAARQEKKSRKATEAARRERERQAEVASEAQQHAQQRERTAGTTKPDYYEVLGVDRTASPEEIKKAYRQLIRKYHPDSHNNDPAAGQKFRDVQEAYDTLVDSEKRRAFDESEHVRPSCVAADVNPLEDVTLSSVAGSLGRLCGRLLKALQADDLAWLPGSMEKVFKWLGGAAVVVFLLWLVAPALFGTLGKSSREKETLEAGVRANLVKACASDPNWSGFEVGEVVLVKESSTRFTGYAEIRYQGDTENVSVVVTTDGESTVDQWDPPRRLLLKKVHFTPSP